MVYFTSDTHFNHKNIIKYCNRPFNTVFEMNKAIVDRWNSKVDKKDLIYHLGDFGFGDVENIFSKLNGRIFLCIGSHEKSALRIREKFEAVAESFWIVDHNIFVAHYAHRVWSKSHYGSYHLFGHSHGGLNEWAEERKNCMDVGVDNNDFYPFSLNEVLDKLTNKGGLRCHYHSKNLRRS